MTHPRCGTRSFSSDDQCPAVWHHSFNGPVGVSEFDAFAAGTQALANAAGSRAFSLAGGDTLAAIDKYGVAEQISYISTVALEYVEGKVLPAAVAWKRLPEGTLTQK